MNIPNTEMTGYDGLASIYEKTKQAKWRKVFELPTVKRLLQSIPAEAKILDLGCGGGFYLNAIVDRSPAFVKAIDLSQDQIELAQKRWKDDSRINFEVADAQYFRSSETFDVVIGFWILNYAQTKKELENFFLTIADALQPEGVFLGINDNPFSPEHLCSSYDKYGFLKEFESPRQEGSKVVWTLSEPVKLKITNYWWSPQTYRDAALGAGLELEFQEPDSSIPDSATPGYWDFFQENPPFIAIKASKLVEIDRDINRQLENKHLL